MKFYFFFKFSFSILVLCYLTPMCSPSYPRLPALADKLACHPLFKMCQIKKPIMAADDMLKLRLQTRASQTYVYIFHIT